MGAVFSTVCTGRLHVLAIRSKAKIAVVKFLTPSNSELAAKTLIGRVVIGVAVHGVCLVGRKGGLELHKDPANGEVHVEAEEAPH